MFDRILNAPLYTSFKKQLTQEGGEQRDKKTTQGREDATKNGMSFNQSFSVLLFFVTQFLLLCITLTGSGNIIVSNNKKHPKGYLCL